MFVLQLRRGCHELSYASQQCRPVSLPCHPDTTRLSPFTCSVYAMPAALLLTPMPICLIHFLPACSRLMLLVYLLSFRAAAEAL